eukprot:s356_g5.t1
MALPYSFVAAVALFRRTLRAVPRSMLDPSAVTYFQPLTNSVGFPSLVLPKGIAVEQDTVAGVPGEWLLPENGDQDSLLLWAHGGGFMFCSPGTHRQFLAKVADRSKCSVFCPDYRKPPANPFPEPGMDVWNSFKALHSKHRDVFLGGDSAGGNLALEVARKTCEEGSNLKASGVVLLSPWVDLSDTSSESWAQYEDIDFIPAEQAGVVAEIYAGTASLEDPAVSPARRTQWPKHFPPVLLEYAGAEVFRSQIERLEKALEKSGVEVLAHCEDGQVHVYPILDFLAPEAPMSEGFFSRLDQFLGRKESP